MVSDLYLVAAILAPLALACAIGWIIYARSLPARDAGSIMQAMSQ